MYALTILEPWASAIAWHGKRIENRTWAPPAHLLGQRIAIHAGKGADEWREFRELSGCFDPAFEHLAPLVALAHGSKLPPLAGRIVATARLIGIVHPDGRLNVPYGADFPNAPSWPVHPYRRWWSPDAFGHVLAEVRPLAEPTPIVKGALGYWRFDGDLEAFQ